MTKSHSSQENSSPPSFLTPNILNQPSVLPRNNIEAHHLQSKASNLPKKILRGKRKTLQNLLNSTYAVTKTASSLFLFPKLQLFPTSSSFIISSNRTFLIHFVSL
ncbi:hypothetical protein IHE45_14G088000 [Dioscorea alata]|uniref:Uncharacterized protein n=1 Tax=Dioscorea alata TaxID=55571 RepID=A0ACB7UTB8_DIOAL|nr:hypothetical protein IHE45_14G088000 [Dioscorea alata]